MADPVLIGHLRFAFWGLVLLTLFENSAQAEVEELYALIVTNNRSYTEQRPDLHYADDDGAQYYRFFSMVTAEENITLLTRFDEPSRKLHPTLAQEVPPPRTGPLDRAIARFSRLVARAKAQNRRPVFYFVFAGHGHIDQGQGFLELEDGRLGPEEIERHILDRIGANVVHLVLDSCNSFFVINPRKPGGRRWATPAHMAQGFSKRYPHVGVVLSTNAANDVYEWSEIRSGIFSHEVRSGLSGAADADADRQISYDEIEAFIATANLGIKNENYLPKVFVRGPWNRGQARLFDLRAARGHRLALDRSEHRIWIRDAQGIRLIDLYKESGLPSMLVIPAEPAQSLYVQEQTSGATGRPVIREYVTPPYRSETPTRLAQLEVQPTDVLSRGPSAVFSAIFTVPFGPVAFDTYVQQQREQRQTVFGISPNDEMRLRHYLSTFSRLDRQNRFVLGGLSVGLGGVLAATGAVSLSENHENDRVAGIVLLSASSLLLTFGVSRLIRPSPGERAYWTFDRTIRQRRNQSIESIVARAEIHLDQLERRERIFRHTTATLMYTAGGAAIAMSIVLFGSISQGNYHDVKWAVPTLAGTAGLVLVGFGLSRHFVDSPIEQMLQLYRKDPEFNFVVAPINGGAALGLSGRF